MMLRLLNPQALAGLAVSLALAILLLLSRAETRHWKSRSAEFEQRYRSEQASFATTVADYRAAADRARAADLANAARVASERKAVNERTINDYEARLADVRARAERLRIEPGTAADPGAGRDAAMPGVPAAAAGAAQGAGQDRLSDSDRLTATEQAIQLDALIEWVKAQSAVDNNGAQARE